MSTVTRRGTQKDLDRAAEVLGDAFENYPWTNWTIDPADHLQRVTRLQRAMLEHLGLPFGTVWVTEFEGVIQSVAVSLENSTEIPQSAYGELRRMRPGVEGSRYEISDSAGAEISVWLPNEEYLFLAAIGTSSLMQSKHLGSQTLEPVLLDADSKHIPVLLETSSDANVRFYERHAFHIEREWDFAVAGGPRVWAMRRDPLS